MDEYDVVVVGGGPGGEVVAGRCAQGGLSVALLEKELVGGECSYWGCIPSKTLIRPGDALAAVRRSPGAAEAVTGPLDLEAALARRDYMTSDWSDVGQQTWLDDQGIDLFRGVGRLAGERTVHVDAGPGSAPVRVRARRAVVLATGSTPALPPVPGLDTAAPWDNRDAVAVKSLPRRLLVLGGGAVGAEIAQAFARLGSEQVTVVEAAPRLLAREEPFAGDEVRAALEAEGIQVVVATRAERVHRERPDGPVRVDLADGSSYDADELLVAAGRHPATDELGLESVGVQSGRAVDVDDTLRATGASGGWLFAIGDCNGRSPLTHMAKYQARIAADQILGQDVRDLASTQMVPRVTFTDPQVCAVGLTEAQARDRGTAVRAVTYGTGDVPGAYTLGVGLTGTSKLVVDESRRILVGATFTGPGVQELLHSATVAIAGEVPLERLWHAVPAFPTVSEVWLHLLESYGL